VDYSLAKFQMLYPRPRNPPYESFEYQTYLGLNLLSFLLSPSFFFSFFLTLMELTGDSARGVRGEVHNNGDRPVVPGPSDP
jgi:hypothetical protein